MPLQNRVTPLGEIVVTSARGTLTGNRGVLHDASQRIVRPWQLVRWIACATEFRGRWRPVRYAWSEARGVAPAPAEAIDRVVHEDRLIGRHEKRTYPARRADLPDGTMVLLDGEAWLVRGDELVRWAFAGYGPPRPDAPELLEVLTPRSIVAALTAGYAPALHPSARR